MTTIKLSGGDMGSEEMLVRCDLSQAASPIEVDYCTGDGWESTQYQCADASHRTYNLVAIAKTLASRAVEVPAARFACDADEI